MSKVPLVSILLTVYKRTDFLVDAIESATKQTFQDREIIVVDDSGSSAAQNLCRPYVDAGLIRYRANPQTLGIAVSLRGAIENATGKYLSILNDDDSWEPEFLASLVPPLEADSRRVLAFCDHWVMDEKGAVDAAISEENTQRFGRLSLPEGEVDDAPSFVLQKKGVPLAMGSVFRKDALAPGLLMPAVAGAYDFWITCALAASQGAFYYVPQRLTRYRIHSQRETDRRSPDKSENLVYIYSQMLERGWFPRMESHLRGKLSAALFVSGRDRLYFNQLHEARSCFKRALGLSPGWRPALAGLLSFFPKAVRQRLKLSGD